MLIVLIFPEKPGYEQRTYACPRCEHDVTDIIEFKKAG